MKKGTRLIAPKLSLLLGTLCAWTAQAAEAPNYVMVVYTDTAHGQSVVQGDLDETVSSLTRRDGQVEDFAEQVSLCVALTKSRQFEQAAKYCDMAIAQSAQEARRIRGTLGNGRRSARTATTPKALAMTNRGVLHALAGEPEEARVLFEMARDADLMEEYAQNNLARLNLSKDESGS